MAEELTPDEVEEDVAPTQIDRASFIMMLLSGQEGRDFLAQAKLTLPPEITGDGSRAFDEYMESDEVQETYPLDIRMSYEVVKAAEEHLTVTTELQGTQSYVAFSSEDLAVVFVITEAGAVLLPCTLDLMTETLVAVVTAADEAEVPWSIARWRAGEPRIAAVRTRNETTLTATDHELGHQAQAMPDLAAMVGVIAGATPPHAAV